MPSRVYSWLALFLPSVTIQTKIFAGASLPSCACFALTLLIVLPIASYNAVVPLGVHVSYVISLTVLISTSS